jgi:hypothetical protein
MNFSCARSRWDWAICFGVSALVALACLYVTGISLDLFLGTFLLTAIMTPALCGGGAIALVAGCSAVWLWAVMDGAISISAWAQCVLVLAGFVLAMVCLCRGLVRCGIHPVAVAGAVTFLSLAWLSWPIWWRGSGPVMIHPVFAVNSACKEVGIWTEQRIAYRLITLGQDTPYRLPGSVWPAVLFHSGLAGIFTVFNWIALKLNSPAASARA